MYATEYWGTEEEPDQARPTHGHLLVCYPTREGCMHLVFNLRLLLLLYIT